MGQKIKSARKESTLHKLYGDLYNDFYLQWHTGFVIHSFPILLKPSRSRGASAYLSSRLAKGNDLNCTCANI